jgi:putative membrane protein
MTEAALTICLSLAGACVGGLLACVPGLHVYNVLALLLAAWHAPGGPAAGTLSAWAFLPLAGAMVTAYAVLNTLPAILVSAPDESTLFTVLPGQRYLLEGRAPEAVSLTAAGSAAGLCMVAVPGALLGPRWLPALHAVLRPHMHWILWCIIAFMLLSEWPRGGTTGQGGWRRLADGWRSVGAGLLTFLLSGLLGFVLIYRSPIAHAAGFQNLMPAFVGLFTLPWLVLNALAPPDASAPPDARAPPLPAEPVGGAAWIKGIAAGVAGGGLAAFLPVVSGGIGGFLAGHATALRDDRAFLVSQGASKSVYYAGGLLLFAMPGLYLPRGGGGHMLRGVCAPGTWNDYHALLASVCIGGAVSLAALAPLTRALLRLAARLGCRRLSLLAAAVAVGLVAAVTGLPGCLVMTAAAGIGLLPPVFGSRRMNALGVILLPMACGMSGVGERAAAALGLF